jgi:hypothetical protein
LVAGLGTCLTGCFEVSSDTKFHPSGDVTATVEIALGEELARMLQDPSVMEQIGKQAGGDGNALKSLDLFKQCENPLPPEARPKSVKSLTGKLGKRDEFTTCTLTAEVIDPVALYDEAQQQAKARGNGDLGDMSLTRSADSSSYKLRFAPKAPDLGKLDPKQQAEMKQQMAMIGALLAQFHVKVSISGKRIEASNGTINADMTTATWALPIAKMIMPGGGPMPSVEATIVYK